MRIFSAWSFVAILFLFNNAALSANKVLFDGYYKIISAGQHVGYYVQRYELNPKTKQFISTYYLRTNEVGGNISESLKAYSTDKLAPIKYNFTSLQGKTAKTIDANVRKDKKNNSVLQIKITENGKLRVYEKKLEKGTFFSTFLIYLILQGKEGLTPKAKYKFRAVAEEDGKAFPGEVYVDSETKKFGLDVYKILYTFKRTQFVNFISGTGDSLINVSPAFDLSAEIVKTPSEATKGMQFNEKNISLLFGTIPTGNVHPLAAKTKGLIPAKKAEAMKDKGQ